jgi:hypothetical protein
MSTTSVPPRRPDDALSSRQCSRCRKPLKGDPTLHLKAPPEWWLCPPCRIALLGDRPGQPATKTNQTSVETHRAHVAPTRTTLGQRRRTPGPTPTERPPEWAQLVWRHALELANSLEQHDQFALTLDLLRAAHYDPTTMAHALTLGRTHLRADADDAIARAGERILEAAIAFLGVKPRTDDVARPGRP